MTGGGTDAAVDATSGSAPRPPVRELTAGDVLTALNTSRRGLSAERARAGLERYGPNEMPRTRRRPLWRQLTAQFTDLFAVVLVVASGITFLAYWLEEPRDVGTLQLAVAILGVVVLNAAIGFAQEYSAERTAQALEAMVPHASRVLRDGRRLEVSARDLVPGDVVVLEAGDAADVVAGSGRAVVYATGATTEFGRIYRLAAAAPRQKTPLQHQVASMARRVAGAALAIGALMFAVRLPTGESVVTLFVFALGVIVALVPEELPATLSVSLAIGVRRMARRHALIKQLLAVEALGSTTVVCTDKTGTLTQAEMTVTRVWAGGATRAVTGVGYAPGGEVADAARVRELLRVAGLCCNARLVPPEDTQHWRVLGDTTEGALLVVAAKAGLDPSAEEAAAPRVTEFPFDSDRKLTKERRRSCWRAAPRWSGRGGVGH
ncbi:HAD-IC family P-type ATPase [Streptomyces sp. B21-083]|uniref:HAD-IC family P-type ATPase n=1 Tax=Streptomyces sp. B21-083 TaxID=3039410 RepID=UPI002FEF0BD3